jgi:hypothetical protein
MASASSIIAPLLLSNTLPNDLVVQEIFAKHLYKTIYSVSKTQKDSIEQFHFYFKKIVVKYYNTYDRRPNQEMYFLNVLDNDLFLAINEGQNYYSGQSDVFKTNPELAKLCFGYDYVPTEYLHHFVYAVWCCLSTDLKQQVYNKLIWN